jgi:hypothetical protein
MPLQTLVGVLVVGVWSTACNAATFELAKRGDGIIVQGVKVEGDIVPGDAEKLLDFYKTYGVMTSPVHLRSKGGNVEEAMEMGAIIRRLRLETEVPVWGTGRQPIDPIKVDHQENMICERLLPCLRWRRKQVWKLPRHAQAVFSTGRGAKT